MNTGRAVLAAVCVVALVSAAPKPKPVMTYIHHAPESPLDVRYDYHWEILRTALEKTRPKWGGYELLTTSGVMTEQRQAFELEHATGKLNVMYLSTTPDFEHNLVAIHIPVDKNLGGYCVFLIRDGEQSRFDVFLRAAVEVLDEYRQHKGYVKGLAIEDSIVFYYPLPMYFWFPRTAEGRRLAARAEEGMRMMIADGSYDRIFDKYQRSKIERLHLKTRRIFRIDNPFVGPETPLRDKRLWFDPQTYK